MSLQTSSSDGCVLRLGRCLRSVGHRTRHLYLFLVRQHCAGHLLHVEALGPKTHLMLDPRKEHKISDPCRRVCTGGQVPMAPSQFRQLEVVTWGAGDAGGVCPRRAREKLQQVVALQGTEQVRPMDDRWTSGTRLADCGLRRAGLWVDHSRSDAGKADHGPVDP